VPKPLSRPLGLEYPPQAGQNTGKDMRSLRQRRDDLTNYDKHVERRATLMKDLYEKNYFRDIGNLGRIHKGKSILAPTTPFRSNLARYFPNLQGKTLARGAPSTVDTTPVLHGKVSVVSLLNTEWAKEQCQSFVGEQANPALHEYLGGGEARGVAQQVEINIEENWLKNGLIRLFMGSLRKKYPEDMHARYFLINRGLDDDIREALGIWNIKVGYVFLLDGHCRIRWAGNGPAREDEKSSLVNSLRRLVDEAKGVQKMRMLRQDARPTNPPGEAQTSSLAASA